MKLFNVLLRKELATQLFRTKKGKGKDVLGSIVSALISLVFLALFVYLFVAFQSKFVALNLQNEILVLFIAVAITAQIIFSVPKCGQVLYGGDDAKVILPLPISNVTMLAAKLTALWIKELINSLFFMAPVCIAFGIMSGMGVLYYICTALAVAVASLFVVSFAAIIAPFFIKVKNFMLKRPIAVLIVSLAFLLLLFFAYSKLLGVVSDMLLGNRMKFIFNKSVADVLRRIAGYTLYADWLGNFLAFGKVLYFLLAIIVTAAFAVGAYFVSSHFYLAYLKAHTSRSTKGAKEGENRVRSVTNSLIYKEFTEIFRNPSYLFSYFSVLITLPLFCYLTIGILNELVDKLLGGNFIVPFAILILVMYSCVCNTCAGDVISREENRIMIVKTIPVPYKKQVGVKVGIALGIALVSDLLSVLLLIFTGTVSAVMGLVVLLITYVATSASIINLVASDVNNPVSKAGGENGNVSFAVIKSLILSVILGAFVFFVYGVEAMYVTVGGGNKTLVALYKFTQFIGGANGAVAIAFVLCAIDCAIAFFRLTRNLDERMRRIKI